MTNEKKYVVMRDVEKPVQPNMLMVNAEATSSTIKRTDFSHCVFTESKFFNTRMHETNLEGTAWDGCDFDGALFSSCSFRAVEFVNCDVDKVVINGVNVGHLLRLLGGLVGAKR